MRIYSLIYEMTLLLWVTQIKRNKQQSSFKRLLIGLHACIHSVNIYSQYAQRLSVIKGRCLPPSLYHALTLKKKTGVPQLSVLKAWVSIYLSVFNTKYNATYLSTRTCYGHQLFIITKPDFYSFQKINYIN